MARPTRQQNQPINKSVLFSAQQATTPLTHGDFTVSK